MQDGEFHEATMRKGLEIYDRVGGGGNFTPGRIYGFLSGKTASEAVEYGSTPGDTSMARLTEVEHVIKGGDGVQR